MDELNLEKFKELIGDLEPAESTKFNLDDIMKEVAEAEESLDAPEESLPEEEAYIEELPEEPAEEEPDDTAEPLPEEEEKRTAEKI